MLGSLPTRWIIFLVCGAFSALGCVGTTDTGQQGETGSLSVDLVLAGGIEIDQVGWQITGNGMDMSGDIDVAAPGSTASVEVFGLPPGEMDYTVTLTATSNDEQVTCEGSAPFNVEVGQSTNVMVMLNCKKPRTLGGVRVNGKFNICTQLTKVVVSPLQTSVGNDISLSAQAFDEEGDAIHYIWSGDGGSIADPSAASTTYTCQEVGEHMVTILVTDNDVYCRMATWTVPVTCVPGDVIDLCEDVICEDDGNECTEAACNPANGLCETSNVADGTECDGGTCSAGVCVAIDLCEGVDCDDENECTADACDPADGTCASTNVDNGTPCADETGMCVDGSCMISDLCEGVVCDDTGNDCTVAMCNTATGICDTMNVTDGTECNAGTGACSAGECIDNNLCDGVDCTSANDCVQDGACDPLDGECIAGGNEPAGTACNADSGDVCDGNGACVECNTADDCPDDGNECMAAACDMNLCGQANVMNGMVCDFVGMGDGMCTDGTCVAAPACTPATADVDCDDGDDCTLNTCPDGMCVSQPEEDGVDCDASGTPGACQSGICVADACQTDADCTDDDGNECTAPVCDTSATPNSCGEDATAADGNACDGGNGVCNGGVCAPSTPPPPASATVQLSCGLPQTVSENLVPFPAPIDVTPTSTLTGGNAFTYNVQPGVALDQAFLEGAAVTVFTAFGLTLTEAAVNTAQVQVSNEAGCTTTNPVIVPDDGLPLTCVSLIPSESGFACPGPAGSACGVIGTCTANAGLPYKVIIPTTPFACTTDAECQAVEGASPTAACCTGPGAGCPPTGSTIDTGVCASADGGTGIPSQVSGAIVLDTFPEVANSCPVANASGGTLAICASGNRFDPVLPSQPASETYFQVQVGALPVTFDCEIGVPNNPIECLVDADCAGTVCSDGTTQPFTRTPCTVDGDCPGGTCVPNVCDAGETPPTCKGPRPTTNPIDVTGSVCAAQDANAGATCTADGDCDATCDTDTDQCSDGSACTAPNADDQCLGTGGGTCIPACVTYPIL